MATEHDEYEDGDLESAGRNPKQLQNGRQTRHRPDVSRLQPKE